MRERLNAERADALARIAVLEADFARLVEAGDRTNIDDEHDPEGTTIAFERAQLAALLDQSQARVGDLDRALESLSGDSYGVCESCGQPIPEGRLLARPSARTCVACASRSR